jgi:uncharacterized protein (TIGR00255 family)
MTGFGASQALAEVGGAFDVEVRSVNGKHLKVTVRTPDSLSGLAPQLEELVRARLHRGAVHVHVRSGGDGAIGPTLDVGLLRRLHGQLSALARELGVDPPRIAEVALIPGVVRPDAAAPTDTLWPALERAATHALDQLEAMRAQEGAAIADDLRGCARAILEEAGRIEALVPGVVREQGNRLRSRVEQLLGDAKGKVDPAELAREMALLADRSDVAEEVQRLRSHVEQLLATIDGRDAKDGKAGPAGRKLEFLAQELLREANTMASKAHDGALVQVVLDVKLLVERIREQVANVE